MASTKPVGVKSRNPDRWPSWKIHTSAPNEAPSDSTFMSTALTGSTTEPNARNSSTNVVATTISAIHGSSAAEARQQVGQRRALPADQHPRTVGGRHVADGLHQVAGRLVHRVAVVGDRHSRGVSGRAGHRRALHAGDRGDVPHVGLQRRARRRGR